jgi:hypothetical protein
VQSDAPLREGGASLCLVMGVTAADTWSYRFVGSSGPVRHLTSWSSSHASTSAGPFLNLGESIGDLEHHATALLLKGTNGLGIFRESRHRAFPTL